MEKEQLQAFSARITQASKSELVVIQYEIILAALEAAKSGFNENDLDRFDRNLKKAQKFISELMVTLDYQYIISYDLLSLYLYANRTILVSIVQGKADLIGSVEEVITYLLDGFRVIGQEDTSGPVMQNTQQIYAGLTYGRTDLNESYVNLDSNRGFKA